MRKSSGDEKLLYLHAARRLDGVNEKGNGIKALWERQVEDVKNTYVNSTQETGGREKL